MNERIKNVADKRLLQKDAEGKIVEDISGMFHRVADHLGESDEECQEFFTLMSDNYFLPNSPCLVNAGISGRPNQLSACFVLGVPDSIEGIYDTLKETALIHKSGGGTGFSFTNIRPANSSVQSTGGVASGPVSFMKVFDASTEGIKQGGVRRGANMGVLRVDHPDIVAFLSCKRDNVSLVNFNISIAITHPFMQALIERRDYNLINPRDGKIHSTVSAKHIFEMIVDNAWLTGDPGIIFIDRINDHNPLIGKSNEIEATNPCFSYDTNVLTDEGYRQIGSLVDKQVNIWNGSRYSLVTPTVTNTDQDMLLITLSNGQEIKCTKYHSFILKDETKIEAQNLSVGDKLCKTNYPTIQGSIEQQQSYAYTLGFFCGDGSCETTRDRNAIWLYDEKIKLLDYLEYDKVNVCADGHLFLKMRSSITNKTFVPTTQWTIQARLDYLAGLIDSDGTLNDSGGSIGIWSNNKSFLLDVNRMLNTVGINCSIALGTDGGIKSMPNGKGGHSDYMTKPCYRLIISAWNVQVLADMGIRTHRVPTTASPNRNAARYTQIDYITPIGNDSKVYCFTEPFNHTGVFNSQMLGQCGEQPLAPNEACGLGSINLSRLVNSSGVFDYDKLRQVTMQSVLFLHRMMKKSEYPNEKIAKRVYDSAKIGLGHMGFADTLIKLKIPYTSEEAINLAANIGQTIIDASVVASHRIGQSEGTFPLFGQYKTPKHIKHALQREGIPEDAYTPAHSTLTTIAPTGTISIIADCSSGIEPVFYMEQEENRADAVIIHRHPLYEVWKANNPDTPRPGYFQDLNDIDYATHIAIQSTFQRFICSGVSKTVNLPNDASRETVAQIIHEAYYTGCKGTTIYRDGSKANQVISNADGSNGIVPHSVIVPAERPETLEGKTYQIRTGYGDMLVTINSYREKPFEVICQLGKSGASEMAKAEAISRLVSILLRCSVDIGTIINQLEGIVGGSPAIGKLGTIYSIPDALAKIMKIHTNNLTEAAIPAMMKCPECKLTNLQAEGSCIKCLDCGWKSCS